MQTVTGVFRSREAARHGASELVGAGFAPETVNALFPGASDDELRSLPVSETEQPGMGAAIGGTVGAALGAAGGFELGLAATALVPGVGPVVAAGIAGAALLGAGGLFAGAELGGAAEERTTYGMPADELFFYEDALRQGRSLVVLQAESDEAADRARKLLTEAGAESIDAAREAWWIGLRSAEAEHYRTLGRSFEQDEQTYRAGFEAALRRECRGKTVDEAADCLKWWHPGVWDSEAFRRGYERGRAYLLGKGVDWYGAGGQ
jgi:hypothetical protein